MPKNILIISNLTDRCVGCGACAQKCPVKCISMTEDAHGFLRPSVKLSQCCSCGLCLKSCPLTQEKTQLAVSPKTYAMQANDTQLRLSSSSGGVFSLLASSIIANGGVVFGAAFTEEFQVEHRACQTMEELTALRCSKYVQSNLKKIFSDVQDLLRQKRTVLFSGAPCQIAALKAFLGDDEPDLVTCAVRCYGVPSPRVWREYLRFRSQQADNAKIQSVCFRHKFPSWQEYSVKIEFVDNAESYCRRFYEDDYMRLFLQRVSLRPSCDHCEFKGIHCNADIILGDFWEIDQCVNGWNDGKGTSVVTICSAKGQNLFDKCSSELHAQIVENIPATAKSKTPSIFLMLKRRKLFNGLAKSHFDRLTTQVLKRSLLERGVGFLVRHLSRSSR